MSIRAARPFHVIRAINTWENRAKKNGNPVLVKLAIQQFGYFTFTFSACISNRLDGGITWIVYSLQVLGNDRKCLVVMKFALTETHSPIQWNARLQYLFPSHNGPGTKSDTYRRAARAEQCARYFWMWTSWTHQTNWLRMSRTVYTHRADRLWLTRSRKGFNAWCVCVLERASCRDVAAHRGEVATKLDLVRASVCGNRLEQQRKVSNGVAVASEQYARGQCKPDAPIQYKHDK